MPTIHVKVSDVVKPEISSHLLTPQVVVVIINHDQADSLNTKPSIYFCVRGQR